MFEPEKVQSFFFFCFSLKSGKLEKLFVQYYQHPQFLLSLCHKLRLTFLLKEQSFLQCTENILFVVLLHQSTVSGAT